MRAHELAVPAADDFLLAATLFEAPAGGGGSGAGRERVAVLAPAMGVKRSFYAPYAAYLAERGLPVLTFDYRGVGGSRPPSLRGLDADLRDWALGDLAGVLDWVGRDRPDAELLYVAHSVGAQLFGLVPQAADVRAMVAVTPGTAYWRLWERPDRYFLFLLWHALLPGLAALLSYFPAGVLGLGADMPEGVAREWSRWARHPDYMVNERGEALREGCRAFRGPIRAYSFTDDRLAPRRPAEHLLGFYRHARIEHRHVAPSEFGLEEIGHLGFFRETTGAALWRESADWLLEV